MTSSHPWREGSLALSPSPPRATPGRSEPSAELSADTPCSCLSENKKALRTAGRPPRAHRTQCRGRPHSDSSWLMGGPPSVTKAAPPAAPGDSTVPVGRGSAGGSGETEAARRSPALSSRGEADGPWTHFSATLRGSDCPTSALSGRLLNGKQLGSPSQKHEDEGSSPRKVVTYRQWVTRVAQFHTHTQVYVPLGSHAQTRGIRAGPGRAAASPEISEPTSALVPLT